MALTVTLDEVLHVRGTPLNSQQTTAVLWQLLHSTNSTGSSIHVDENLELDWILLTTAGRVLLDNRLSEEKSAGSVIGDLFRRIRDPSGPLITLQQLLRHPHNVRFEIITKMRGQLEMSEAKAARIVKSLYSEVLGSSNKLNRMPRSPHRDNGEGYLTEDSAISSDNLSRHASSESLSESSSSKQLKDNSFHQSDFTFRRRRPIRLSRAKSSVEGVLRNWEVLQNPLRRAASRLYQLNEELSRNPYDPVFQKRKTMSCQALNVNLDDEERAEQIGDCRGPEFVVKSSLNPVVISLSSNVKKRKRVTILLLDGRRVQLDCDVTKTKISQALKVVIDYLAIDASDVPLFGLATLRDEQFIFPRSDEKLLLLAPDQYKHIPYESFTVYFRIKFYVCRTRALSNKVSTHLAYLQFRKDLLEQRWKIGSSTELELAAMALLIEFGPFNSKVHGQRCYFHVDHYLSNSTQRQMGGSEAAQKLLVQQHRSLQIPQNSGKLLFMEKVIQLPNYGYHSLHVVEEDGIRTAPLTLLVGLEGIRIIPQNSSAAKNAAKISFLEWGDVKHIAHSKHHVIITLRNGANRNSQKLKFCVGTSRCREAFELLTSHQKMKAFLGESAVEQFEEKRSSPTKTNNEVQSEEVPNPSEEAANAVRIYVPYTEEKDLATENIENLENDALDITTRIIEVNGNTQPESRAEVTCDTRDGESQREEVPKQAAVQNSPRKPTLVRMGTKVSAQALYRERLRSLEPSLNADDELKHNSGAYIIDASVKSEDEDVSINPHESISDSLAARFDQLPRFPSPSSPAPTTVRFNKDENGALGILVAQGIHGGIYIMGINPGGPADLQTDLKQGDRIVTVNGVDCSSLSYADMVDFLRRVPRHVEMTVLKACLPS